MTRTSLECSAVVERLISGERPGSDPQLGEHVGSCLSCFRTAADLRGLPQLREQLLRAQGQLPDPGEAFWKTFPADVSVAWERSQQQSAPPQVAGTAPAPGLRERLTAGWESAWAWVRLPVPAACAGALSAAVIMVLAMPALRGRAPETAQPRGAVVSGTFADRDQDPTVSMTVGGLVLGGTIDDSIKDLDVGQLRVLRSTLEASMSNGDGDATQVQAQPQAEARGRALADGQAESGPTALSDDLDELSEAGLAVLAENLGGPI
jgi:hypothetical protein